MEDEVLFIERQKFKQWWLWLILLGIDGLFVFGVIKQVILGQPFGEKPSSNTALLVSAALTILFTILFANVRLDTLIKKDGIYVKFFPLHLVFRHYTWDKISRLFVRKYSPILEYGGWGLRFGLFGKGKAFNVSGDIGLQLEFSDNKKLLIGTDKSKELIETLRSIGQLKQ